MRYRVVTLDYDGTMATSGRVDQPTIDALERCRRSGRSLILVTGRQVEDLLQIFPQIKLFDRIVAENGGVLYNPATKEERPLGPPPPPEVIAALKERGVTPVSEGRVIIATWQPHENIMAEVLRDLGLEYHIIFNKGAVMALPSGINKAS